MWGKGEDTMTGGNYMKGSRSRLRVAPEEPSRRRRYLTLVVVVVSVCLSFGAYNLLVDALVSDGAGEGHVPFQSLAAPNQTAIVKIDPASQTVDPGGTLSVMVRIENVVNLGAFQFELTYDPAYVAATSVALGPFLGSTGRSVGEVGPMYATGVVTYGAYSFGVNPGPSGDGVLATITLQATTSVGTSALHLQNVLVTDTSGGSISANTEDGDVTVGVTQTPSVTSVTPNWGGSGQVVEDVIVVGDNFHDDASVQLTRSGESPISASMPDVQGSTRISCTFNLGKAAIGKWTVRVTNPDSLYGELADGFTVKALTYLPILARNY
jgi:hypothetical protein